MAYRHLKERSVSGDKKHAGIVETAFISGKRFILYNRLAWMNNADMYR